MPAASSRCVTGSVIADIRNETPRWALDELQLLNNAAVPVLTT